MVNRGFRIVVPHPVEVQSRSEMARTPGMNAMIRLEWPESPSSSIGLKAHCPSGESVHVGWIHDVETLGFIDYCRNGHERKGANA